MKTTRLGKTGYQVSEIGFGAWGIGADRGAVAIRRRRCTPRPAWADLRRHMFRQRPGSTELRA